MAPRKTHGREARSILLRWSSGAGDEQVDRLLAFVKKEREMELWRTLDAEREAPAHVATLPVPFGPHAVARHLVVADLGAAIEADRTEAVEVEGADDGWAKLLERAWTRGKAGPDAKTFAILTLDAQTLAAIEGWQGDLDANSLLTFGEELLEAREAWLAQWRPEIDAEVQRRLARSSPAEAATPAATRGFVEGRVLALGRLPRDGEDAARGDRPPWARTPSEKKLRDLGLVRDARTRKHNLRIFYVSPEEVAGGVQSAVGWYAYVTDPDDDWRCNEAIGPERTPEEAAANASWVDGNEEGQDGTDQAVHQ